MNLASVSNESLAKAPGWFNTENLSKEHVINSKFMLGFPTHGQNVVLIYSLVVWRNLLTYVGFPLQICTKLKHCFLKCWSDTNAKWRRFHWVMIGDKKTCFFCSCVKSLQEAQRWMLKILASLFPLQQRRSLSSSCHCLCGGLFSPLDPSVWEFSII